MPMGDEQSDCECDEYPARSMVPYPWAARSMVPSVPLMHFSTLGAGCDLPMWLQRGAPNDLLCKAVCGERRSCMRSQCQCQLRNLSQRQLRTERQLAGSRKAR